MAGSLRSLHALDWCTDIFEPMITFMQCHFLVYSVLVLTAKSENTICSVQTVVFIQRQWNVTKLAIKPYTQIEQIKSENCPA